MTSPSPPPVGGDWTSWARQINAFLIRRLPRLQFFSTGAPAAENGIMQCAFVDVETGRRTDVDLHVASASDEEDHVIDQFTVE